MIHPKQTVNKIIRRPGYPAYLFLIVCIWLLSVEEPAARLGLAFVTVFRNLLPVVGVVLFLVRAIHRPSDFAKLLSPTVILAAVFALSGMIGWAANQYQNLSVTAQSLYGHLRFFVCIMLFTELFKMIPIRDYAARLFLHAAVIASVTVICGILDFFLYIWPRQMFRYGTSSLQLFYGHPSNLAAHCVFLIGLFCALLPYLQERPGKAGLRMVVIDVILTFLLLGETVLTLRVRLFGFAVFFLVLYVWMLVARRRLSLPVAAIGVAGAFAIGWRRLYDFYFSPYAYTMARGQFAINSLDIAKKNLPFGSGFGTFGSRLAQINYSPLYYKYRMMTTVGMAPSHPSYACDTFFPMILAESGWLGFAAYLGMLAILTVRVFRIQKDGSAFSRHAAFSALMMLAFEFLETTGTLAFSETYSVMIAMVIGLCFAVSAAESSKSTAGTDQP